MFSPTAIIILGVLIFLLVAAIIFSFTLIQQIRKENEKKRQLELDLHEAQLALTEMNSQYQLALEVAQKAEDANQAKSMFLATMSHELRTPLNAVLGMTDIMLAATVTEEQKDCLSTIKKSGEALLAIIGNVLDYSKIESGKLEISPEMFTLGDLVGELELMFRHSAKAKDLGFDCSFDMAANLRIYADRHRLRQVMINLLGNAIKFTEQGKVTLIVLREAAEAPPEEAHKGHSFSTITITVSDTGIGIPDDKKATLFQPFTQADSSHTRRFGGTGLGLAISKKIMELMNGVIECTDNHPRGSVFKVRFVARSMMVQKSVAQPFAKPKLSTSVATPPTQLYKKAIGETFYQLDILVVEDDPQNRKVINLILNKMGQKTNFATNGKEAIDYLLTAKPDVILMDVGMPVMDGMEATKRIRAGEAGEDRKDLPIVALTAYAVTTDREKILASGMDHYLSKPVQTDALREVLTKIARAKREVAA